MNLFLIRKTFFDMWDNLFRIMLINIGFIVVFTVCVLAGSGLIALFGALFPEPTVVSGLLTMLSVTLICFSLLSVFTGASCSFINDVADYKEPGFKDFFIHLAGTYKPSLLFGLINSAVFLLTYLSIRFYFTVEGNFLFTVLGMVILWLFFSWLMASQFFFPLQARINTDLKKNVKKMYLLFFDNTAFAILVIMIGSFAILALSIPTLALLPGIGTILLYQNVALKLRMYKYDYLEKHPEANRRKIPWEELIKADRDKVGKRTIKGMIFPWKE